ncbi:cytochrome bc1 complex cytochrome b subunit [Nonomuraea sediminis]|uniref:cytochrome bc1 complex cytochrome b subunit n=1 Tax=Nonomuraea sediminis TaxID=2835864 RepID=UPI001BDD7744|nr:cytochrome b N-terminal domain-containing protein [Nonomuraea sediminis]
MMRFRRMDHWSFLFGEIALYCFAVLTITGGLLAFLFDPDMSRTIYDGSYAPLRGVGVSKAFASTLDISFEVRGGLLLRQIHHWAALIFIAAVCVQLLRLFFTGAFRRPRGLHWLVWIGVLLLGMAAGITGGILPDDMLSGGSLGLIQGVTQSIPVIGTFLAGLLFGAEFPGEQVIPLFFWLHVLLLPAAIAGLLLVRRWLVRRHGHTYFAGAVPARTAPSSLALFVATCAVLSLLGTFAQINPIWQYGPYQPGAISAGSVPGWYMGFLDGAIRIMPGWEVTVFGYTLTLAVLVPALLVPGAFFTVLAAYPLIERKLTGDRGVHHVLDRPREAATRTAVGAAGVAFYGLLWAAAANDQIAYNFHVSLYAVTWFFRVAVFAGPLLAYAITRRLCLYLAEQERETAQHGLETGVITMTPEGGFREITTPLDRPAVNGPPAAI